MDLGRQMADNGCRVGQEKAEGGKGQSKTTVHVLVLVFGGTKVRVQHHILPYSAALMEFPTYSKSHTNRNWSPRATTRIGSECAENTMQTCRRRRQTIQTKRVDTNKRMMVMMKKERNE